jgi:DNA gyrase/topoisomerase IV subunit A
MRELQDKFQNERSQLEMEIRRVKEILGSKSRENEEMNYKINEMTQKLSVVGNL